MDSDLDLRYFEKGGFDLDLKFIGFDLKKFKSTPNPSLVNLLTHIPCKRSKDVPTLNS